MNIQQARALLWLRWHLTRNQLIHGTGVRAILAGLLLVLSITCGLFFGLVGLLGGALLLEKASPLQLLLVWDVVTALFLFVWLVTILTELQRPETIELSRLMHLPVALNEVFLLNYIASHLTLGMVIMLPGMLGLAIGLILGRGAMMLLLVPLLFCFVFMITAWVYWLRGWLAALMLSKRRRRAIVVYAVVALVLLGQIPSLMNLLIFRPARTARQEHAHTTAQPQTNSAQYGTSTDAQHEQKGAGLKRELSGTVTTVHAVVPFLWLANGARTLAAGNVVPAMLGGAGSILLGWLGLRLAYQSTMRFYRGESRRALVSVPAKEKPAAKPMERDLPRLRIRFLPDDVLALAFAQRRAMARAPEIKMLLPMDMVLGLGLLGMILFGFKLRVTDATAPFVVTAAVGLAFYALAQLLCNQFGYDRDGFRALMLLPTPRDRVLFGKNLAVLPLVGIIAAIFLLGVTLLARLPVLVVLAGFFQFVTLFALFCIFGNAASVLVPYRIALGSLKQTKTPIQKVILFVGLQILMAVVVLPALIPPVLGLLSERLGLLDAQVVNLAGSGVLAVFAVWLYRVALTPLGRLLQKRETQILQAVATAPE